MRDEAHAGVFLSFFVAGHRRMMARMRSILVLIGSGLLLLKAVGTIKEETIVI